jgi:lipopolysaccharide export system protein LptA
MKSTNLHPAKLSRALCLLLWLPLAPAYALSTDKDQPIHVEADSVEIDDRTGVSIYQGDVDVKQGSIHLTADKVTVYQKERRTERVKAVGRPVRFQQRTDKGQTVKGRAREVEYHVTGDELVLTGEARLSQGDDNFSSDRIIYDRKNARVKAGASAEGKERVRITISPDRP